MKKKEMILLTKKEQSMHDKAKACQICKERFSTDLNNEKYHKVRDHCHHTGKYRGATHIICNLRYNTPREISAIAHNGSTYGYHLIIKKLGKEFEGMFECLDESTDKYITLSVPINKQLHNGKTITYRIRFKDSYRFMSSSLSNLVNNLSEGLHSEKCAHGKSHLDYMSIKDGKLIFRCFRCKINYEKKFNKELIKRFANMYKFCNKDVNKFILLLRKSVYSYEYMDNWKRFDEITLPDKKAFYSNLNMEDITDVDYRHAKKVFKEFKMNNLGDYHDRYVITDVLLLADVFESFRNMCVKEYELDTAHLNIN